MSELLAVIYSTKYLFTDGIKEFEAEIKDGMAVVRRVGPDPIYLHGEGKEWHRTKESAVERAEEMRIKKLQSLDKKTKAVSAMKFDC